MTYVYFAIAVVAIAAAYAIIRVHEVMRFQGRMLIRCPETRQPAAVKVSFSSALMSAMAGRPHLVLCECSRWPERADCDQHCLPQVQYDPEYHRVWNIMSHWYEHKKCFFCKKPIEMLSHLDRQPGLLTPEKKTVEWTEVAAEKLPELLPVSSPVCWSCHMIETVIREHPDRIVFRPWEKSGPIGEYVAKDEHEKGGKEGKAA